MTDLLVYTGNAARGKEVFMEAMCSQCHVVNGKGTDFGPNLTFIGDKLSKKGLYKSILDPSAGVSPTYTQHLFELTDGRELTGYIVSETSNDVSLKMAGGVLMNFETNDIVARHLLPYSIMPDNLQSQMNLDDFVDLIEYMTSLKE